MSFWNTFVGKTINNFTGGMFGAKFKYTPNPSNGANDGNTTPVTTTQAPPECYSNLDYYAAHLLECMPTTGVGIVGNNPVISNPIGNVSSVPEPSGLVLALCGAVALVALKRFTKKI